MAIETYWMKKVSLCSQRQQPQTRFQIPGSHTRVKLLKTRVNSWVYYVGLVSKPLKTTSDVDLDRPCLNLIFISMVLVQFFFMIK